MGQKGNRASNWKGGKKIKDGYSLVILKNHPAADPCGYVREHRIVLENKLGRYLKTEEVVHHIDGNKLNNNPQNLYLFADISSHGKWHKRLESIALYD